MNRDCIVTILGILVHNGILSLSAADHYLKVVDKSLEDGVDFFAIDKVLGALNG